MKKILYRLNENECYTDRFEVKTRKEKLINEQIKNRLLKSYPGDLSNLTIDYIKNRNVVLVFYIEKSKLDQIRFSQKKVVNFRYGTDGTTNIFSNKNRLSRVNKLSILYVITILLSSYLGISPIISEKQSNDRLKQLTSEINYQETTLGNVLSDWEYYRLLQEKNKLLKETSPPNLYNRLSLLSTEIGLEYKLLSITVKADEFQCQAIGKNPLVLVEKMTESSELSDITIQQIQTDSKTGLEIFSMRGSFNE